MQLNLLQTFLWSVLVTWMIFFVANLALSRTRQFWAWSGTAIQVSFCHAWMLILGIAIGYLVVSQLQDSAKFILLLPLWIWLVCLGGSYVIQQQESFIRWSKRLLNRVWQRGWQIIVGILLGYILSIETFFRLTVPFGP